MKGTVFENWTMMSDNQNGEHMPEVRVWHSEANLIKAA